jgi:hypothetical protein
VKVAGKILLADIEAYTPGKYKICAQPRDKHLPAEQLGALTALVDAASCVFIVGESSPCNVPECASGASEYCMQYIAQYCVQHAQDQACSLFVPRFERATGELTSVKLHSVGMSTAAEARLEPGTTCGAGPPITANVLGTSYRASEQLLAIDFVINQAGTYAFCAAPFGGGSAQFTQLLGTVDVTLTPATFDLGGVLPCAKDYCADPTSEKCIGFTAEYCTKHPDEQVCAFLRWTYERVTQKEQPIGIVVKGLTSRALVHFVAGSGAEACNNAASHAISLVSSEYTEATMYLEVRAVASLAGQYALCAAPYGGLEQTVGGVTVPKEDFDFHIADVMFVDVQECTFGNADGLTPCGAEECIEDPNSEACMQFTAEYCASRPEDTGCALVVPLFRRTAFEVSDLQIFSSQVPAAGIAFLAPLECGCADIACRRTDVTVLATAFDASAKLVAVTLEPHTGIEATYAVCLEPQAFPSRDRPSLVVHVASLAVVLGSECVFAVDAAPCEVCADATSEACVLAAAAYCAERPLDTGCSLFRPHFERSAGVATTVAVLTTQTALDDVHVVEAGQPCSTDGIPLTSWADQDGAALISLTPTFIGDFLVCVQGSSRTMEVVASLSVTSPGCVFGASGPCSSPACADPMSDMCMQVIAE